MMRVGNVRNRLTLFTGHGAVDVERASGGRFDSDPQAVYDRWPEFTRWAAGFEESTEAEGFHAEDLGAPSPRPRQVFAIGVNYRSHAAEGGGRVPDDLLVFAKWPSSFVGPVAEVVLPSGNVDWEAELVVVIGERAHHVTVEQGWSHVAGLSVGQDLSERVIQRQGPYPQWGLGKSFPGFSPSGPWLVTPDELADRDDLKITCTLNGQIVQQDTTSSMVFSVPELVSILSRVVVLEPGDVIFTGTPAGVGFVRKPPVLLQPGDELVTRIDGIGEIRQTFTS